MIKKIDDLNFYELLEISPLASSQEVHKAYDRVRRIYDPNSIALYSLFTAEETAKIRQKIEEAYRTLAYDNNRRRYDRMLKEQEETPEPHAAERFERCGHLRPHRVGQGDQAGARIPAGQDEASLGRRAGHERPRVLDALRGRLAGFKAPRESRQRVADQEEDDAEDEQHPGTPVDDDPADVERDGQGDQARAEDDEDQTLASGPGDHDN